MRFGSKHSHEVAPDKKRLYKLSFGKCNYGLPSRERRHACGCRRLFLKSNFSRRKLERFLHALLDETREAFFVSLLRLSLNLYDQFLDAIHFQLCSLSQAPAQYALQRLDENHQQEQKDGGGSFRRQERLQPRTHAADEAQVEQRKKRRGDRIEQILLPPDLQEVTPVHQVDEHGEWHDWQQR